MVAVMAQPTGFGGRLKAIRTAKGLTLEQVAELTGIRFQNISRLEAAEADANPTWQTVMKLASALGVTPDAFYAPDEEPDEPPVRATGKRK